MYQFNMNNLNNMKRRETQRPEQRHFVELDAPIKTVSLFSQPYLDTHHQCYKNIVVVNMKPAGPLGDLIHRVQFPRLSEFKQSGGPCTPMKSCGLAIRSFHGCGDCGELMTTDEIPTLISYLMSNNYKVDTSITKMFNTSDIRFDTNIGNKLICFVTYNN